MRWHLPDSADERARLRDAEAKMREDWGFAPNVDLPWLLDRWERFVSEVETGFHHRLDEYTYELSLRDEIETIMKSVPERLSNEIRQRVAPSDHRFRFATKTVAKPLLPDVDGPDKYWWSRVPKLLHGELLEALKAEGIV
jgi:hypothetical protein